MSTRGLYSALGVALATFLFAFAALVYVQVQNSQTQRRNAEARVVLIRFVCTAIDVRREAGSPDADLIAARYGAILRDLGETCR